MDDELKLQMAKKNKRFPVGALNAILKKKRGIASRLSDEENELLSKSKKVNTLQRELNRLKKKVSINRPSPAV